ncbi:MAG: hypothetical protein IPP34_08025 [Bacteroidetes bacterium]|nr:hypothetical protein [Bacteroidota bacterium]
MITRKVMMKEKPKVIFINFTLNIRSENAQELISNPEHNSFSIGTVTAPALSPEPLTAMEDCLTCLCIIRIV